MNETQLLLAVRGVPALDWPALVGALHDADLDSPRRSTVPLVAYWRDPLARFTQLLPQLGLHAAEPPKFSFEHRVSVAAGRGKPSYTDLMIVAPQVVIAIEQSTPSQRTRP